MRLVESRRRNRCWRASIGLLIAVATLTLETVYDATDRALAATMGFAVFSLFNIAMGLSSRSETETLFQMSTVTDRRQLGIVPLDLNQWLVCIGTAVALVLVYEVMKFFLRRSRSGNHGAEVPASAAPAQA